MKVIGILFLLVVSGLLSSCSSNNVFTKDDDLLGNELCGEAIYGENACFYVKELNFYFDGNLYGKEYFTKFSKYLNDRVTEIDKIFSKSSVKANFKPFSGGAWAARPKENDSNIEITFLLTETIDKKFIIITFYTFSKGPFYIETSQCPANESSCVIDKMRNLIDEFVIKSMTKNGN